MPPAQKSSRWGSTSARSNLVGLSTAITAPMTSEQIDAYALHVRIQEITQKLRFDDVIPANQIRRSPSPEPQYDSSGKRINTRYQRHRRRLEDERHSLIRTAMDTIPSYTTPPGYVPRHATGYMITDKVYIPVKEFPEVNFIGQLLGPRGRSLAEMNTQSGTKIVIRGKGSVKEGKGRHRAKEHGPHSTDSYQEHEPLHCLITAETHEKIEKAKIMLQDVIETIVTTPDQANQRKCQQLRDLAVVNGTFRDDESRAVRHEYLGGREAETFIKCGICGGGHVTRDCADRTVIPPWRRRKGRKLAVAGGDQLETEYQQLLSEI
ncbi:eukaryotic type KH-domain (KH-domain type I) [Xylaria arbuscula]|nr:eukaryotic type KH-domain (KH-domain type I) [Xylaria arbuscula]